MLSHPATQRKRPAAISIFRCCQGGELAFSWAVPALHHLALGTRNVAALADFYRDVLELAEVQENRHPDGALRSVWLDLGGALLMIEATAEAPRHVPENGAGLFLFALVASPEEKARFELKLAQFGLPIEARTEWTLYARDPDGNRIALSAYPIASRPGR
jgi:glyoxylase I family protein